MLEKDIERKLVKTCQDLGWLCIKQVGTPGVPDRLLISPEGDVLFVELKTLTGKVSTQQTIWLERLRGHSIKALIAKGDKICETIRDGSWRSYNHEIR